MCLLPLINKEVDVNNSLSEEPGEKSKQRNRDKKDGIREIPTAAREVRSELTSHTSQGKM